MLQGIGLLGGTTTTSSSFLLLDSLFFFFLSPAPASWLPPTDRKLQPWNYATSYGIVLDFF